MSNKSSNSALRRITGRVRERESGLGASGLIIRAFDNDLLFDDLLGNALTDESGSFEINYPRSDYEKHQEGNHDIYLVICAPPNRPLTGC